MSNNFNSQDSDGPVFAEADIAKARRLFERGQELAEKKNYDYAIECYLSGLALWPEAVDEGHKPCRAAALFRGKKKVSFTDGFKFKITNKDAKTAMLNAEAMLSREPQNISYLEGVFKNAAKAGFTATTMWIGEILADTVAHEAKPDPARFITMREVYEELADATQDSDPPLAIAAMERTVQSLQRLRALKPTDMEITNNLRDVAGKLTILQGQYSSAESFRDSVQDNECQRELHDKERIVQSEDRLEELVDKAYARYEADPNNPIAVTEVADLLCRHEKDTDETRAIDILTKAYEDTRQYRFKQRADDIRMKQLSRKARRIVARGDRQAARQHVNHQRNFELEVFKERVTQYPTDLRMRYQYGVRLFRAKKYDEAIPVLQEARNDPKARFNCSLYIGRCFFEKEYPAQAADTFREALDRYELPDDELGKELHYWLGRSCEADGNIEDALKIYGQLIQWDYNYRKGDVRKRIDDLRGRK